MQKQHDLVPNMPYVSKDLALGYLMFSSCQIAHLVLGGYPREGIRLRVDVKCIVGW